MAKKNIKTTLKTKEKCTSNRLQAIIHDGQLRYIEEDCKMIVDIGQDCATMIRKNSEYEILFHFEKKASYGHITLYSKGSLNFDIVLLDLKITEKKFFVSYIFNDEVYEYCIEY